MDMDMDIDMYYMHFNTRYTYVKLDGLIEIDII